MTNETNVEQWVKDEYKKWCKTTNRGGGVLMGQSIIELLTHFAALTRQGVAGYSAGGGAELELVEPQGDETAQGEINHELDLEFPRIKGETTDPTAKTFLTKEKIDGFSALTSRTAEQKAMSQEEVDRFLNHADEMNEELQSRITALEAENKRLREGWVSCNDRLPELNETVFICCNVASIVDGVKKPLRPLIAIYKGNGMFLCTEDNDIWGIKEEAITHWRELPTPPAQTDNK
jgi:hypothetical protein